MDKNTQTDEEKYLDTCKHRIKQCSPEFCHDCKYYIPTNKIKWIKSTCPFCGKKYEHTETYHPKTCGNFECMQKANKAGLFS